MLTLAEAVFPKSELFGTPGSRYQSPSGSSRRANTASSSFE
jgi:hypothetical protein